MKTSPGVSTLIQLSSGPAPALAVALPGAAPIALPAATEASPFTLALDALLVPGAKIALPAPTPAPLSAARQPLAASGKDLPVIGEKEPQDEDAPEAGLPDGSEPDQEEAPDPAALPYVWVPAPLPVETPPLAVPLAGVAVSTAVPEVRTATGGTLLEPSEGRAEPTTTIEALTPIDPSPDDVPLDLPEVPTAAPAPPRPGEQRTLGATPATPPAAVPANDAVAPVQSSAQPIVTGPAPAEPVQRARPTSAPAPAAPALSTESRPALTSVAAIAAAFSPPEAPSPLRRSAEEPVIAATPQPLDAGLQPHQRVRGPAHADGAPIDMRRQEWTGQMIERIEAMRDASSIRDTRIRFAPDALGNVDVAIRHEGDRVHVHFTAETPAARQLLTDAQPRLTELAEARGLKLGQTSVDGGAAGQGSSGQRHDATPRLPSAPASARSTAAEHTETDDRIA